MSKSLILEIEGVGPVLFEKSRRAKRLNISVRPTKGVRVAVPYGVSFEMAAESILPKSAWIQKHVERFATMGEGEQTLLKAFPPHETGAVKEGLRARLAALAKRHGFTYNRIFIRNQRTRWGSCSVRNNINLNIKVARLPDDLAHYVILHELLHTRIKNHSRAFWSALDELVGDAKGVDAKLKRYRLGPL